MRLPLYRVADKNSKGYVLIQADLDNELNVTNIVESYQDESTKNSEHNKLRLIRVYGNMEDAISTIKSMAYNNIGAKKSELHNKINFIKELKQKASTHYEIANCSPNDICRALSLEAVSKLMLGTDGTFGGGIGQRGEKILVKRGFVAGYEVINTSEEDIVLLGRVFKPGQKEVINLKFLDCMRKSGIDKLGMYSINETKNGVSVLGQNTLPEVVCIGDNDTQIISKYANCDLTYDAFIKYKISELFSEDIIEEVLPLVDIVWELRNTCRLIVNRHSETIDKELELRFKSLKEVATKCLMVASIRSGTEVEHYALYVYGKKEFIQLTPNELFTLVNSKQLEVLNCSIDTNSCTVSGKGNFKLNDYAIKIPKKYATDDQQALNKAQYINTSINELFNYMNKNNAAEMEVYMAKHNEDTQVLRNLCYFINSGASIRDKIEGVHLEVSNDSKSSMPSKQSKNTGFISKLFKMGNN